MSVEDQIQFELKREAASAACHTANLKTLRKQLRKCAHKYTSKFTWEHDNGYGKQTKQVGLRCASCFKEKPWESSDNWYNPEDLEY